LLFLNVHQIIPMKKLKKMIKEMLG